MLKLKYMNVCIIGDGLISITLAKALVNQGIYVDIFASQNVNKINKSRTLALSKANVDFFNENILNISNLLWEINKIEIYSENLKDEKILNFENDKKNLFCIVKNHELYRNLILSLKRCSFFKKKNIINLKTQKYDLIINCDRNSFFSKKYFYKKLVKDYNSYAHTTIINHKRLIGNNTASQIFTKKGPLAFLPISETKTSVVYSFKGSKNIDLENFIKKYNNKYSINKIEKIFYFELKSSELKKYYYKNILAFGDLLHKLHPLAGQGFNMSIRDIKLLLNLIRLKIDNGLELDNSICVDFEKHARHKNYLFSQSIDFVYEFFNLERKIKNPILIKSVRFLGKNKYINKIFTKFADNGLMI